MNVSSWSPSRLNMLYRCGEQYRRRYIEGEVIPPDLGLIRGRATHKGVEANMASHIETGNYLMLEAVEAATSDALTAELAGEFTLGNEYQEYGLDKATGLVKDESVSLATLHATDLAPKITPEAAEVRIEVPASNTVPAKLVGVLDLIDDQKKIRDVKTSRKSPPATVADNSTQLTFYELLYHAYAGEQSGGQVLDYLVRTPKRGDTKIVTLETTRSYDDLVSLAARIEVATKMVEKEVFLPAPEDSWQCSEKFCGYASTCPFFRSQTRFIS